jgi:hypothetical protein
VENFYTSAGYMFPEYSFFYWFGLWTKEATWPTFVWQDASFGKPNPLFNYTNWGLLTVPRADGNSDAYPEPNRWERRPEPEGQPRGKAPAALWSLEAAVAATHRASSLQPWLPAGRARRART